MNCPTLTNMDRWFKSSRSGHAGNCVEVCDFGNGRVGIRDSKNPDGSVLAVDVAAFNDLVAAIKRGEFDQ